MSIDSRAVQEESHRTKALLRLTMACNERCPFCNVPMEDYAVRTPPFEEVQAELQTILDAGEKTLTISGGEPTLYRDRLTALCQQARDGGISFIELQSNAVLIDEEYAQELASAGVTSAFISLLSHLPELHDELAGLEDAFDPCLRGIDALITAGIAVTLNPVTAHSTQDLLADYVDFVAKRFPDIRSISCSAVQPHGRAAQNLHLLPDYATLGKTIEEARERSEHHQIELLNPYCGVPACVGWKDDLERSVEAFEAVRGGFATLGLQNLGNKRHGAPCTRCALRTRCGGAWHAYWDVRHGSGIDAPIVLRLPWETAESPYQRIHHSAGGLEKVVWEALKEPGPYTLWYWTDILHSEDARLLLETQCTDIAIELDPSQIDEHKTTLKSIKQLTHWTREWQQQHRIRVWCGLDLKNTSDLGVIARAISLLVNQGATGIALLAPNGVECREISNMLSLRFEETEISVIQPFRSLLEAESAGQPLESKSE